MKKIVVLDSNAVWQREFVRLCVHLTSFLGQDSLAIRHVGSTAVPGLAAKPFLDIDIVLAYPDDLEKVRKILERRGYYFRGDLGIEGRFAFGYGSSSFMRHHLYVVKPRAQSYLDHLALREGLRADSAAVERYAQTKRRMAKQYPFDIDAYVEGKTDTIKEIMDNEAGKQAVACNKQFHLKEFVGEQSIRLKTTGDLPGEILFNKSPYAIIEITGSIEIREHLIGFSKEISLGYK